MAPLSGAIRPPGTLAQIDVLRSCVFLRKYYQNSTVSLGGYPRGYIIEPRQPSFLPSARPRFYPRIHPWACSQTYPPGYSQTYPRGYPWTYARVYSWTYPRVYAWTRCDPNCFHCGHGEAARLNVEDLRPRKPQPPHAPVVKGAAAAVSTTGQQAGSLPTNVTPKNWLIPSPKSADILL